MTTTVIPLTADLTTYTADTTLLTADMTQLTVTTPDTVPGGGFVPGRIRHPRVPRLVERPALPTIEASFEAEEEPDVLVAQARVLGMTRRAKTLAVLMLD